MALDVIARPPKPSEEMNVTKRRILMMVHEDLVPPSDPSELDDDAYRTMKTECDVVLGLTYLGHEVRVVGLRDDLAPMRSLIDDWQPHVVFNLLEEFREQVVYDAYIVGYLELKGVSYTGCNPRGLVLARDKALSKKILSYHRIRAPRFAVFPKPKSARSKTKERPKNLQFPLIVKSLIAEGSAGISQASIVRNDDALAARVRFIHEQIETDAIVEEFVEGRELYVAVMGNKRLTVLPIWELLLDGLPESAARIATSRVKWNEAYQDKYDLFIERAEGLSPTMEKHIRSTARRICKRLNIDGAVRIDFRLRDDGTLFFLEANPNPDIGYDTEFACAAAHTGLEYCALLQKLVTLAESRGHSRSDAP